MKKGLLFFFLTLSWIISGDLAFGADQISATVSPLIIDERGGNRDIFKHSITLKNVTSHKIYIYPTVNNVTPGKDGKVEDFVNILDSDRSTSLANWIEIQRGAVELMPNESATLDLRIQIYMNAKPGMYHARISFPEGLTRASAEQRTQTAPFTMVNVQVVEDVQEFMELRSFKSLKNIYFSMPADFTYELENTGNRDLIPAGELIIFDRTGKELKSMAVNTEGKKIAPQAKSEFYATWDEGLPLGRFKAFLNINYGDLQRANINDTIYITVIPARYAIGALSVFMVFTGFVMWRVRKRKKRKVDYVESSDAEGDDEIVPTFPQIKKAMYKNPKTNEYIKERVIEQDLDIKLVSDSDIESVALSDVSRKEQIATLSSYDLRPPIPAYARREKIEIKTPQIMKVNEPSLPKDESVASLASNIHISVQREPARKDLSGHVMDLRGYVDTSKRMDLRKTQSGDEA